MHINEYFIYLGTRSVLVWFDYFGYINLEIIRVSEDFGLVPISGVSVGSSSVIPFLFFDRTKYPKVTTKFYN